MLALPVNAAAASDPRWITSIVLRTLARLAPAAGATFNSQLLAEALPCLTVQRRRRGTTKLLAMGFITHSRRLVAGRPVYTYTTTADGEAAIAAAASGALVMAGRLGTLQPTPATLRARLWLLLRMRKVLDCEEAAQLLCDAGESAYISKRNRINDHLRRWHQAGAVELSKAIGYRGRKRYVLVNDPGPAVPRFLPRSRTQQAAP